MGNCFPSLHKSATSVDPSRTQQAHVAKTEPEPSFHVFSQDELNNAVDDTWVVDATLVSPINIAAPGREQDDDIADQHGHDGGEHEGAERWDCLFTDLAVTTYPPGRPDEDPVQVNEYIFAQTLGAGSFGCVKLVRRDMGKEPHKQYAMKILSRHRLRRFRKSVLNGIDGAMRVTTGEDMVQNEIEVMRHLYHRNVVVLFEVINDLAEDNIYMAMEYLEDGPSMTYDKETKRFSSRLTGGVLTDDLAAKLFFGLVSGLQYLHSKRICHRDIKPENLMLTERAKLRITDFGCATRLRLGEEEQVSDTAGSFSFLAPECYAGEPYIPWPADVWAAAVTLYCFIFGQLPFQREGIGPLFEQIAEGKVEFPSDCQVTVRAELAEIMRGLFIKDPVERWGLDKIRDHPWLAQARLEDEEEDRQVASRDAQATSAE